MRLARSASVRRRLAAALPLVALTLAQALPASAQDSGWDPEAVLAATEWVRPPEAIADAVLAPRYLNASLREASPDGAWFVHEISDGPVTMDRFSLPFDELGGLFVDRSANRERRLTTRSDAGLQVISARDGRVVEIQLPSNLRVSNARWSPDGSRLAFYGHTGEATHIWVADPASGDARQVTRTPVLATLWTDFQWTADGREIATVLLPRNRAPRPQPPAIPSGPQVKRTMEGENMLRTYASLMETPHDEALLEWHATGQLAVVEVESRRERAVGVPAMIREADFSPDGAWAMVTTMRKPFSYIVPVSSFGEVTEVWDRDGTVLAQVSEEEMSTGLDGNLPSAPGVGGESGEAERRQVSWRKDGSGLTFLQLEPEADDEAGDDVGDDAPDTDEAGERENGRNGRADRVMLWRPPFDEASLEVVYENRSRMNEHRFSPDYGILFASERRGSTTHEFAVFLDDPETRHTLYRWDSDEFYENPGRLVMEGSLPRSGGWGWRGGGGGETVLLSADGGSVFLYGTEYAEDPLETAPVNFLDRLEIRTGEKDRIFAGENEEVYEELTAILDPDAGTFVISRESPTRVPQYYRLQGGDRTQLTDNVDYTPDLTAAPRERFVVERPDGFRFLVNVILPGDYEQGERLPAMFWFYPREYTDQESYDERGRTFNRNEFQNFGTRSMEYLVRLGYAVVEPDAPIVGDEGQMNNNYEHDLRNNLAVVIDSLDARGIVDRGRLGLGGHSYGAFSTLNAMVHTPFFKAGIAGDGNYNRTFTPLRFQRERRILWDARDTYLGMSPFLYADELTGAVLLYHGLMDQNVGTDPDHSPRLFHALNGLGKDAAMYLYPFEDHGPATRETLLDLWARWAAWLQVHLGDPSGEAAVTQQ